MSTKVIPFNSYKEAEQYLDACSILIGKLQGSLSILAEANPSNIEELEQSISKSLDVLVEGMGNLNSSIRERLLK